MAFKLGNRNNTPNIPSRKPMVFKKSMDDGSVAQANNDGTIDIDPSVDPNSAYGQRVLKHEMKHIEQMQEGRSYQRDDWVMWEGNIYIRGEKDGINYIDGPNGRWPEGHPNHPWEAEAIQAEKAPASFIPSSSITPSLVSLYHMTLSASSGVYF